MCANLEENVFDIACNESCKLHQHPEYYENDGKRGNSRPRIQAPQPIMCIKKYKYIVNTNSEMEVRLCREGKRVGAPRILIYSSTEKAIVLTESVTSLMNGSFCFPFCFSAGNSDYTAVKKRTNPYRLQISTFQNHNFLLGCRRWPDAQPSCVQACDDSSNVNNWVLYCVLGCNHALGLYIDKIKAEVGTPSAPFLGADTLTNESLTIEWKSAPYPNITYLVQWRYEVLGGDWNYYMPDDVLNASRVEIKGLNAYTQYRFRVEWIVLPEYGMTLFSHQSVTIATLAYGVPSTPPTITSAVAVSATQMSVSWEAPRFPNGPIISYALLLSEYPNGTNVVKDMPNSPTSDTDIHLRHNKSLHYMFNSLKVNTTYNISILTRNNFGEGPKAQTNVTTHEIDIRNMYGNESSVPELFLATDREVLRRDPQFPIDGDVIYRLNDYSTSADISGLAVHVQHKYLFVSDTSGTIRRINLKDEHNKQIRTIVRDRTTKPSGLSVDWLADKLYMIEESKISRCTLDGDKLESVITGFKTRPADMKVDPYNGYLYWMSISDSNTASLYRIDLALIANDVIAYNYARLIYQEPSVTAFAVDFINYRIFMPISREASIFSITIDGNDRVNVRHNSQRNDLLESIDNLVVHDNLFYFTKGNEVYNEEYDRLNDKYHHSSTQIGANNLISLCVFNYSSQPYPVPLNPVKSVQSVFLDRSAKIVWEKPDLLGDKGQGAWQQWSYEVSIEETLSRITFLDRGLTSTYCEADELNPNTEYNIKVRAYSAAGNGSWSQTFQGKTLHSIQKDSRFPFALWSTREGVLKSNIVGDRVEHLVHRMNMNGTIVNDISWYRDVVFLNGENNIFIYNLTSHASLTTINNITGASSIAVDWIAPKLYWSSPAQRMISRSNLDGSHSEPLPIMTFAKEIAIDSRMGYIYWATGYSVEFSRLNGMDRIKYFETNLFAGKHIMGLTLNLDTNLIFWILRSYEGVVLYSANLANGENTEHITQTIRIVGHLPENHLRGPLSYYSDRMFWLEENQNHALISGENGENFAVLKGLGLNDINTLTVVDPSLQPIPKGFASLYDIQVIPNDLKEEDIKLTGVYDNFTIFWKKCENVNYDQVFYELVIEDSRQNNRQSMITHKTKYPYPLANQLAPYSKIKLAIRAFTYWASSKQTVIELYSPMSTPTKPSKPRIFINYERSTYDNSIEKIHAEFRWSPPELPNGVILGYTVNAWSIQSGQKNPEVESVKVYGQTHQIYLSDLKMNTSYYFQVQAFTEAGDGPPSDVIGALSSNEHPVPRLLVTKQDSIRMADIDSHEEKILTTKAIIPVSVTYISKENLMFWVEEDGILKKSYLDGTNITIIRQMHSPGSGLTVDWIGRHLYWSETDFTSPKSTIWSYDLNDPNAKPVLVTSKNNVVIGSIEVDPFSSTLIWTEMFNQNKGYLKMCDIKSRGIASTASVRPFFQQNKARSRRDIGSGGCNCTTHSFVSNALTIDRSNYGKSELLWYDLKYERIMASDMTGCRCRIVINNTYGFPPTSMAVDNDFIYWSNASLGNVYKMAKYVPKGNSKSHVLQLKALPNMLNVLHNANEPHLVMSEIANGVHGIKALSDHLQPYPHFECLVPMEYHETVRLQDNTANSLTISMQEVRRPLGCAKTTLASVKYTIYYGKVLSDGFYECGLSLRGCTIVDTFNDTITLTGLEPFTNYTIRVAVKNFYTSNNSNLPGPPVNFETAETKPSPPRNVAAKVETPHRIRVMWEPPEKPNGDPILYEMRWYSQKDQDWHKAVYTRKPETTRFGDKFYMEMNDNIKPGLTYFINIRAYSSDGLFYSESETTSVTTYKLPNELYLVDKSSRSLRVSWDSPQSETNVSEIGQHTIQYCRYGTDRWIGQEFNSTQPSTKYVFSVTKLTPNTEYAFRLLLTYRSTTVLFKWPETERYVFKTLGDAPEVPETPLIDKIPGVSQTVYKVWWTKINGNGAQNVYYNLWYKLVDKSADSLDVNNEWTQIYNGTENYWFITNLSTDKSVAFKLQAVSEFGSSNYSEESEPFEITNAEVLPEDDMITIAAAIMGAVLFVVVVLTLFCTIRKRQVQEQKKKALGDGSIHRNTLELVPWPELPGHPHHLNTLYTNSNFDLDNELMAMNKIQREQISETQFLGSGAFGENKVVKRGFDNPGYSEDERQAGHSSHSLKNSSNSSGQSCSSSSTLKPSYQNGHIKYEDLTHEDYGLTDADGYQIPISKSPLQVSVDKNQLLNTMNQIVVLNTNDNTRRPQPTAASRRKPLTDSMGSCSPPPTYSQVFKATEVALNCELNNYENNGSIGGPAAEMPTNSHNNNHSVSLSHDKTKNSLLVINDNKTESIHHNTNQSSHSSSLSSSPTSCMTSTSSSPIIAAALLKSQSSIIQLSQPSRHMTETKYCFNGKDRNHRNNQSLANSSVETSEEDYDTDFDAEGVVAANDLFCNAKCNTNNNNNNTVNARQCSQSRTATTTTNPLTGYTNPLINVKMNDQNQSKYALITRLDHQNAFPTNNNHSFNYDNNSSWC
ncbi:unnamed protein product [Medioppia subpectinata]|uniref:Fibronectin type-III domain-containing protein n=1 Tax=Medioppia subpectinata TaxID=1979941 RepID=A0A7R9PTM4_9ACAR|nr:unnamed protein product [Medioppia subpectinata]CAG2100682.1 unnamed protein product [Medioppia subpectinata]